MKILRSAVITVGDMAVIVDEEDLSILNQYPWYLKKDKKKFYVRAAIFLNGKQHGLYMHRLLTGMAKYEVDHINRDPLDNRKSNLRLCMTAGVNSFNRKRYNKFGYKGVTRYRGCPYFTARIMHSGKRITIGNYVTAREAAVAYDEQAKLLHKEFASLNFPEEIK